jgi:DNA-binding NarL/FixJ family response regulator
MRILLADDHTLFRAGIRSLLDRVGEVTIVAETGDGREALDLIEKHRPDIALLDITMPGLNGLEVAARVSSVSPGTRILILSMHANEGYVAQALRAGVAGYLLKDAAATELEVALRAVSRGDSYLSPAISRTVVDGFLQRSDAAPDPLAALTARQREILQLIAEGRSTREIAEDLGVSVKTVETHRSQLMDRLNIHDIPGLVRFAIRAGLVSSDA